MSPASNACTTHHRSNKRFQNRNICFLHCQTKYIACRQVHKASCQATVRNHMGPYHVESWLFFNCVLLFPVRPSWCLAGRRGRFNFTDADATLPSFQAKCYPHPEIWRHRQAIWPKRYVNLPHVKINPNQSKSIQDSVHFQGTARQNRSWQSRCTSHWWRNPPRNVSPPCCPKCFFNPALISFIFQSF